MRLLVVDSEDELLEEPWASLRWDRVIDLGKTGELSYLNAVSRFGCQVHRLAEFRDNFREMARVRELLALGIGQLYDRLGLDWWELTSILFHQQLEMAFLLRKMVEDLGPDDELYITRSGFPGDTLRLILGPRLHSFSRRTSHRRSVGHYLERLKKFPVSQLMEIFWDKTDPGYQIRGVLGRRGKPASGPLVLLPSAYGNVSRTVIAYAESLPETQFLLVLTRRSGWVDDPPPNVMVRWLSSYASVGIGSRRAEYEDLKRRWGLLRSKLAEVPEIRALDELGYLDQFPKRFASGLEIRDAWHNLLNSEPVQAVICADDTNPYTHIPLLLAVQKGISTIACHHGALDGRHMIKQNHADVVLAKGKMEQDYLVRRCGIRPQVVEIGAPRLSESCVHKPDSQKRSLILFFSEAYEVASGRARGFYQDMLPLLAKLALSERKQLIIKLHPSESFAERSRLVREILSYEEQQIVKVIDRASNQDLLDRTWFAVTIMSSVVVECALRQVPCFLCAWLESWPYGYCDQFTRFQVGIRLNKPAEISSIPSILDSYQVSTATRENCWTPIEAQRFGELLGFSPRSQAVAHTQD